MMELLITCAAKITLVFVFAILFSAVLRQKSAALRHQVWTLALLCAFLLPVGQFITSHWITTPAHEQSPLWSTVLAPVTIPLAADTHSMVVNAVEQAARQTSWKKWLFCLWVAGFLLVACRAIAAWIRLLRISNRSQPLVEQRFLSTLHHCLRKIGLNRSVTLLCMPVSGSIPCTWGLARPFILLPPECREWPEERIDMVLLHELAHIQRFDWPLFLLAEVVRAVYWFHPLVWWAIRSLREESEYACDDVVLVAGKEPAHYAQELLQLVRCSQSSHKQYSAAVAAAHSFHLERRFTAMLNPSLNRHRVTRKAKLCTGAAALIFLLPLAALRSPAQETKGSMKGSVLDPRGAFVPAATVIMVNAKAHTRDMTATDVNGTFRFESLPAGEYEVRVLKPGFKEYTASEVFLNPTRDTVQNMKLEMGSISEQVQVYGTASAAPTRLAISGSVQAASLIQKVTPMYPLTAKSARIQGAVVLEATIGTDGVPVSLQVVNGQIDPDLARSAVEAVSQWRYQPTLLNGQPIEVRTNVTVNYTLAQ